MALPRKDTVRLLADALRLTGEERISFSMAAAWYGIVGLDQLAEMARSEPELLASHPAGAVHAFRQIGLIRPTPDGVGPLEFSVLRLVRAILQPAAHSDRAAGR